MNTIIKRDDQVIVDAGRSKGKRGRVLKVFYESGRALVEGANMINKATRPNPRLNQPGGFVKKEASIHLSNLLLFCTTCDKGVKVKRVKSENGKIQRICKKCNNPIDKGKK
jgi:large subunit ribosomal protein L24